MFGGCTEKAGDSTGALDLTKVVIDRPILAFYMSWTGTFPRTGSVDMHFVATSANGQRSHLLGVRIVDRQAVRQYVRDLQTGAETTIPLAAGDYHYDAKEAGQLVGFGWDGLGAIFPEGTNKALGDGWTWQVLLKVDGVLIDSCASTA